LLFEWPPLPRLRSRGAWLENSAMRLLIALLIVIYLVGVGVELSPTIQTKWSGASASELVASVVQELPDAMAWPARLLRRLTDRPNHI
jgi:hypothetical protein